MLVLVRSTRFADQSLEIIPRPRAELKPDPANPRQHSKKQIQQIAESIRAFGFNVPILVDRDGHVIAGHAGEFPGCPIIDALSAG
jgi:hypothetical protein